MVVALSKFVNGHLSKQFQARSVVKRYLALLLGELTNDDGEIDMPIAKSEFPYQKICWQRGKPAQSRYKVLERRKSRDKSFCTSKVLFTPSTGRTHQLRVHSREIGHPIIGCDLYGQEIGGIDSQHLSNRLMLHASSLEFEHPISGKRITTAVDWLF